MDAETRYEIDLDNLLIEDLILLQEIQENPNDLRKLIDFVDKAVVGDVRKLPASHLRPIIETLMNYITEGIGPDPNLNGGS
jgi:hypothetical protein